MWPHTQSTLSSDSRLTHHSIESDKLFAWTVLLIRHWAVSAREKEKERQRGRVGAPGPFVWASTYVNTRAHTFTHTLSQYLHTKHLHIYPMYKLHIMCTCICTHTHKDIIQCSRAPKILSLFLARHYNHHHHHHTTITPPITWLSLCSASLSLSVWASR